MRTAAFLLLALAAGCGHGPPSGRNAWADKAARDWAQTRGGGNRGEERTRFLHFGPSWEPNAAQARAMERQGGAMWLPIAEWPGKKTPAVVFAQEVTVRQWHASDPREYKDAAYLLVFGKDRTLIADVPLDGGITGPGPGEWLKAIPPDPDAVP